MNIRTYWHWALGLAILAALYSTSFYNYLLFHTLAESFSIIVSCAIFILSWNSRRFLDNTSLLFLGMAYLFIGGMDLLHTLAYRGMGVFPGYKTNLPTQLWIATRYMESLSILIALCLAKRRIKLSFVLSGYSFATFLILVSIFGLEIFPTCFVEETGLTSFKKTSEYIVCLILVSSVAVLFKKREDFDADTVRLLMASIIFTIISELAFTYYVHAYGLSNLIGHYFKIISAYFIYKAIVVTGLQKPYDSMFRNLKKREAALQYRAAFEELIAGISAQFIGMPSEKIDESIEEALKKISRFANADGGYVFLFSKNKKTFSMTHLWKNENLSTTKDALQDLEVQSMSWWINRLKDRKPVVVPSLYDLPEEASAEKEIISRQGIQSLIDVPMTYIGDVIGFLGFSCVKMKRDWSEDDIFLLKMVGEVFTNALQRQKTESALRESEERYRRIVQTAQEGIYLVDAETNIVFANKRMTEMLGYTFEEMCGRPLIDYIDEFIPAKTRQDFHKDQSSSEKPRDFRFRNKNGKNVWAMITSSPIYDDKGEFFGALGMVVDVTYRKEAEKELEKAHEELKEFVDVVTHDLKNPIFAIRAFCQLLVKKEGKTLGEKSLEYIHHIETGAQQMAELIADLLELSRAGHVISDVKNISSGEIVKTAVSSFSKIIDDHGIELVVSSDLPTISWDEKALRQVFENLISNAVKYTKGTDDPRIEIGYEGTPNEHVFYIKDNGSGIDPEHHDDIFNIFSRLKETEKEEGTGLGLAIVKKIVTSHGGQVWVDSKKEQGATFYFTLPKGS